MSSPECLLLQVILQQMELITSTDVVRNLSKKLAPPLVTLLSAEPEIQYVALRNINLIVQRRPGILAHEIKVCIMNRISLDGQLCEGCFEIWDLNMNLEGSGCLWPSPFIFLSCLAHKCHNCKQWEYREKVCSCHLSSFCVLRSIHKNHTDTFDTGFFLQVQWSHLCEDGEARDNDQTCLRPQHWPGLLVLPLHLSSKSYPPSH